MGVLIGIGVSILMFSLIVIVHELGHFKSARFFGVKVEEFGLGIPPRARSLFKDKKGTLYSLNWLPLGGFVRLKGENLITFLLYDSKGKSLSNKQIGDILKKEGEVYDKFGKKVGKLDAQRVLKKLAENDDSDNLLNKPYYAQSIIILGGVVMNFLLSIIIFSVLFYVGVQPIGINDKIDTDLDVKIIPTVEQALRDGLLIESPGLKLYPIEGSPASEAGVLENDTVIKINSQEVSTPELFIEEVSKSVQSDITLTLLRENTQVEVLIKTDANGKIGAYIGRNISLNESFKYKYPLGKAIVAGTKETYSQSLLTLKALKMLLGKIIRPKDTLEREEAIKSMSGPIGIVDIVNKSLSGGITLIIILGAIISINLGVFNLLPIPALDGGRFIFILINGLVFSLIGKRGISYKIEAYAHGLFLLLLIALSVMIGYNDIIKILS